MSIRANSRVAQAVEQLGYLVGDLRVGALHLALVALRGIEQQQRVAGRGGVEHHDPIPGGVDRPRERAEHRDLLGARRPQILLQQRAALVIQPGRAGEHLGGVTGGLHGRVDPLDQQAIAVQTAPAPRSGARPGRSSTA